MFYIWFEDMQYGVIDNLTKGGGHKFPMEFDCFLYLSFSPFFFCLGHDILTLSHPIEQKIQAYSADKIGCNVSIVRP